MDHTHAGAGRRIWTPTSPREDHYGRERSPQGIVDGETTVPHGVEPVWRGNGGAADPNDGGNPPANRLGR